MTAKHSRIRAFLTLICFAFSAFAGDVAAQGACEPSVKQGTEACGTLGLSTTYVDVTNTCSCDLLNITVRSAGGVENISRLTPRATKRVNIKICGSTEGYFDSLSGTLACAGQQPARFSRSTLSSDPQNGSRSGAPSTQPSVDELLKEFGQKQDVSAQTKAKIDAVTSAAKSAADANEAAQKAASERSEDAELRKRREAVARAAELDRQRRAAIARQRPPPPEPIIGSNPYNAPAPPPASVGYCNRPGYLQCAASRCPGNPAACAARCACE